VRVLENLWTGTKICVSIDVLAPLKVKHKFDDKKGAAPAQWYNASDTALLEVSAMTKDIIVYILRANGRCYPRTVSARLPEPTLLLSADLSPHQASFDDSVSSDLKTEASRFNAGMFMLVTLLRLRLRSVPPEFHTNSCFTLNGAKTVPLVHKENDRQDEAP